MNSTLHDGPRRAKWCAWGLLALLVISIYGWCTLHFDSAVESLLPEGSEARQTISFLRDSSFADKAVLRFKLTGNGTTDDLIAAADATAQKVDPTLIKRVLRLPKEADALEQIMGFLDRAGELLTEKDLQELDKVITPEALQKRMRQCYMQLTKPEGSFMQQIIRRDPAGINARVLARLYALTNAIGYKAELRQGHLVHPNGRELILVMETAMPVTSISGSQKLVKHLDTLCAAAPAGMEITPICGHIHTAQNNEVLERDMQLTTYAAAAGFLLVFLGVYRDWRAGAVFLIPILATAIAIGICGIFTPNISSMVVGLASALAGDAIVYAIHVYGAARLEGDPYAAARRITKPLVTGMVTTLAVFLAFLFSRIPAYRQLGMMAGITLSLSLLAALWLLPALIRPGSRKLLKHDIPLQRWGAKTAWVALVIWALLGVAAYLTSRVAMDSDISRLDGVSPKVTAAEKDFQKTWGRGDGELAIVVASGKTREEAAELSDRVYASISECLPGNQYVSFSGFWPSLATRKANLARWNTFWNASRLEILKQGIAQATARYGFATDAFDPFLQSLAKPANPDDKPGEVFASIEQNFVLHNGDWKMLSFLPDTAENVTAVRKILHDQPGTMVVSRRALGHAFADAALSEARLLAWISICLIVLAVVILIRNITDSILSLLPAISALLGLLALLALSTLSLNLVSIIAASAVIGLCVNYGTLIVHGWKQPGTGVLDGLMSIHLAAIMTLVGTAALLFARHPAIFLAGATLSTGVVSGYAVAFLAVPGTLYLRDRWRERRKP